MRGEPKAKVQINSPLPAFHHKKDKLIYLDYKWIARLQRWLTRFYFCSYGEEGRLTVTDHSMNFSRTYEGTTDIIPAFLTTDFSSDDHIYVGGLPEGVMVSEFLLY